MIKDIFVGFCKLFNIHSWYYFRKPYKLNHLTARGNDSEILIHRKCYITGKEQKEVTNPAKRKYKKWITIKE